MYFILTSAMARMATVRTKGMDQVTMWKYDVRPESGWWVVPRALKDVCQAYVSMTNQITPDIRE